MKGFPVIIGPVVPLLFVLWNHIIRGIVIPKERAWDINDELDLKIAEILMKRRYKR